MPAIHITTISETVISKTSERGGGYLEIIEIIGVDQYGKQWYKFHSRFVFDPVEPLGDKPPTTGSTDR